MSTATGPSAAQPWASVDMPAPTPQQQELIRDGTSAALRTVEKIRSRIPSWQRSLGAAANEAGTAQPDWANVKEQLELVGSTVAEAAEEFAARDQASSQAPQQELHLLSAQLLLGSHSELLVQRLREADSWVTNATAAGGQFVPDRVVKYVQQALAALAGAMQHALFLTLLGDLRTAHVGERRAVDEYCTSWGLSTAQVDMVWTWLSNDALRFGGEDLPVALDTQHRSAYRKADKQWKQVLTASTAVWGFALAFGLIVLLFAILNAAGVTQWPGKWTWKLVILLLFVTIGAVAHLGSRALNINYDSPMKVYDAGNIIDWLSLRWVSVIQMYIPIVFVVASLWGAGNIPTSFQKLGTAILAGYSADSLIRAAASKLQSKDSSKPSFPPGPVPTPIAAGGGASAAPLVGD